MKSIKLDWYRWIQSHLVHHPLSLFIRTWESQERNSLERMVLKSKKEKVNYWVTSVETRKFNICLTLSFPSYADEKRLSLSLSFLFLAFLINLMLKYNSNCLNKKGCRTWKSTRDMPNRPRVSLYETIIESIFFNQKKFCNREQLCPTIPVFQVCLERHKVNHVVLNDPFRKREQTSSYTHT